MRFSIKGLLIAVAAVAIGCAALLKANAIWAGRAYGTSILAISAAILGTLFRQGKPRAFWCGFAIFGWIYLLLMGGNPNGSWAVRLPTHQLLRYLHGTIVIERRLPLSDPRVLASRNPQIDQLGTATIEVPDKFEFNDVGHPLFLLMFSLLGGVLGRHFQSTEQAVATAKM